MKHLAFSVLMSVYSKENPQYLKAALDSLFGNTALPKEIVIVKDGILTEELEKTLSSFSSDPIVKIIGYEENRGLGYALNYGLRFCTCEFVARMDSDDLSSPDRFEKQIALMETGKYDLIGSNTAEFVEAPENPVSYRNMPETQEEILRFSKKRNPFIHPSVMFRKEKVIEAGSYQTALYFEDYYLWIRMLKRGARCYNIQDNLVYMRVSPDFYERRGGIRYVKHIRRFFFLAKKEGYFTKKEYLKTYFPRMIVSLSPNFIRKRFYEKKLRSTERKGNR